MTMVKWVIFTVLRSLQRCDIIGWMTQRVCMTCKNGSNNSHNMYRGSSHNLRISKVTGLLQYEFEVQEEINSAVQSAATVV